MVAPGDSPAAVFSSYGVATPLAIMQARTNQGLPGGACQGLLTCKQVYKSTAEPEEKSGATNCSAEIGVHSA
jgi:hypothetical protein